MNRQERRLQAKQGIDHKTLKAIQDEAKRLAVNHTTTCCAASAILVLRDEFGFGEKRAQRFMAAFTDVFDDITQDRITVSDVLKTIEDELQITFQVE